jgi:purine nucleosidase
MATIMTGELRRPTVFLDCDTGIDDALAIAYLARARHIDLVGIGTVSGNVVAPQAARNTLDLLALAGRSDVPVAVGALSFLAAPFDGGAPDVHGSTGTGGVVLPRSDMEPAAQSAVELLLDLSHRHSGVLDIVTIGPMTNIALALQADPTLPTRVRTVTAMGGAALVPGNIRPHAEANIHSDPEAAAVVLSANWDITLVPLDITEKHRLGEQDRAALLASGTALNRCLGEMLDHYFEFYVDLFGYRGSALHDPLAAAVAVGGVTPVRNPAVEIVVDTTNGPGRGQTLCDLRRQEASPGDRPGYRSRVLLEIDRPFAPLLMQSLLAG